MRRFAALLVTFTIAAAACGTTTKVGQRASRGLASDDEVGLDATQPEDTTAETVASGGTGATKKAAAATSAAASRLSTAGGNTKVVITGPGVDDKAVNVGVIEVENSAAANAALGASGISQPDSRQTTTIVVDDINAHGGVAGHKINLVWHTADATSADSADVQEQQTCDDWTKDNKIWVAMEGSGVRDLTRKCIGDAGALLIADPLTTSDSSTFQQFKYYVEITAFRLDRMAAAFPDILNRQGYFSGWSAATGSAAPTKAKIGILTYDYPTFTNAVQKVLLPKLAKLGHTVDPDDVRAVTWLQSNPDTGTAAAGVSSAVLRFRQDNVTHVLIIDERGLLTLLFVNQAQSQQFFPRYGWNTQNGPQALKDGANFPSQQLRGSKGMGWLPGLDISAADDPPNGPYSNDTRRQCNALYRSKGVTFGDRNAEAGALGTCTSWWFFRDVMNRLPSPINRAVFMAGLEKLGTAYSAPGLFQTFFGPNQHDGVGAVRQYAYDAACDCMRYTSGDIEVR